MGGPLDALTGVLVVGPVEDVRVTGAYDDDIVVRRNYLSSRPHGLTVDPANPAPGPAFVGEGWTNNLQARFIDLAATEGAYVFVREDGRHYRFNAADLSDSTARGWKLTPVAVAPCGSGGSTQGWVVGAQDGRRWEIDGCNRVTTRRTQTGAAVTFSYDSSGQLTSVQNSSGQSLTLGYGSDGANRLSTISLGSEVLATYQYTGARLTLVCYGADCSHETYGYTYEGGSPARLLTKVHHGTVLEESHTYCAQIPWNDKPGLCPDDRVKFYRTSTEDLELTYADPTCGGTVVEDHAAPAGDPWRKACLRFDSSGRLTSRDAPTGCPSNVRGYSWEGAGSPLTRAFSRAVGTDSASQPIEAWTEQTFVDPATVGGELKLVQTEVENATDYGAAPPAGVTRTTSYTYYIDDARRRLLHTASRTSLLDPNTQATTTLVRDDAGNITERYDTGVTRTADGARLEFHYVSCTTYVPGTSLPELKSGPDEGTDCNQPSWHTRYVYYPSTGGSPLLRGRLYQVVRMPTCIPTGNVLCVPEYVEREYQEYDELGRPTKVKTAGGEIETYEYDARGRQTKLTRSGEVTVTGYDMAGRVQYVLRPGDNSIHYYYGVKDYWCHDPNPWGRLMAVTRVPPGWLWTQPSMPPEATEQTIYCRDSQGNVTTEVGFSLGATISGWWAWDRVLERRYMMGRVSEILGHDGQTAIALEYDHASGAVKTRHEYADPASVPPAGQTRQVDYTYEWGRLKSADGATYGYDRDGNLTSVKNEETSALSTFEYDDLGRLVSSTTANGGLTRYEYTARGAVAKRVDAANRTVEYTYDSVGRLREQYAYPNGGFFQQDYDICDGGSGQLCFVTNNAIWTTLSYDSRGRLTEETRGSANHEDQTVRYDYAAGGQVARVTYPNGSVVDYVPDSNDPDRDAKMTLTPPSRSPVDLARDVGWHSQGRVGSLTYGNGLKLERNVTPFGEPQYLKVTDPSDATRMSLEFVKADRLERPLNTRRSGAGFTDTDEFYSYDSRGQLVGAALNPSVIGDGGVTGFSYRYTNADGTGASAGNRTHRVWRTGSTGTPGRVEAYVYSTTGALGVADGGLPTGSLASSDRLYWVKDPHLGPEDCEPADAGAAAGHDNNGCRDWGLGLGCHDGGPEQRQRDAGQHGGPKDDKGGKGGGGSNGSAATGDGGIGTKPPCQGGHPGQVDRSQMAADFQALVEAIRGEFEHPEGRASRSFNRIGGLIARFLAKYHVTERTFMRALLSQGKVREQLVLVLDRSLWNGPRGDADRQAALAALLDQLALIDIRAVVAWIEGTMADDICYDYDASGNLLWRAHNEPGGVTTTPQACAPVQGILPYTDATCYEYDGWGRVSRLGLARDPSQPCEAVLPDGKNFVPFWRFVYDWKGRRTAKILEVLGTGWTFVYDQQDRLISEILVVLPVTQTQTADLPERNYYHFGGEILAQERLADEILTVKLPGGNGCAGCPGVSGGLTSARGGAMGLALVVVCISALGAVRARGRGLRRRARGLGVIALIAVVGPLAIFSCTFTVGPVASMELYYHHNDWLGTPQRMSDQNQKIVWAARYEPFGEVQLNQEVADDGRVVDNPIRFPGQYDDATKFGLPGDVHNGARYYDPAIGRYTQVDPQTIGLPDDQAIAPKPYTGQLPYAYAANNPVVFDDPTGEQVPIPFPFYPPIAGPIGGSTAYYGGRVKPLTCELPRIPPPSMCYIFCDFGGIPMPAGPGFPAGPLLCRARSWLQYQMARFAGASRCYGLTSV
ncbi:MAG: RHS domain-containing protein [Deltaproteobacteria bacterium]|nr:RHS domain-containing protein [Deltaproteobacteria bacterium]